MESGVYRMEFEAHACPERMRSGDGYRCRLQTGANSIHSQEEKRDFLLGALVSPHFDAKSDRLLEKLRSYLQRNASPFRK